MAKRIGIKVAPDVLGLLFQVGAVITGNHGFTARLTENGIPEGHELVDCGFNRREGQFFFIFGGKGELGARACGLEGAGLREGVQAWK